MHPFRHELDAAHARIAQLEEELADSRRRTDDTIRPPRAHLRVPTPFFLMLGCLAVGVAFSFSAVSRISEAGSSCPLQKSSAHASIAHVRSAPITVAPRGLSTWQVSNVVSRKASALQLACGDTMMSADIDLALDIGPSGNVERATATGPEPVSTCVAQNARGWQFPMSDGVTQSSVPIVFRPTFAQGAAPLRVPALEQPAEWGALAVTCSPQCDSVLEDGHLIGRAPILSHPTRAGKHTLELVSGTQRRTVLTNVAAGRTTEIRQDLSEGSGAGPL